MHHKYKLFDEINKKLKNQRCESFEMIKCVERLIYELKLSFRRKNHFVILIIQFEFAEKKQNSYNHYRFHHFDNVEIEKNIFINNF